MQTNNATEWGKIWVDSTTHDIGVEIEKHKRSLLYLRISQYVQKKFLSFSGKTTIEIGSGSGIYSLIFAQLGANVTMLDYSAEALRLAEANLKSLNLNANLIQADAFNLPANIGVGQYDLAMSFGTVEHYRQPQRFDICKTHLNLVCEGGIVLIETPNMAFLPHEFLKFILQRRKKWFFGYERCFSRLEMGKLANYLNLNDYQIVGSSLRQDLKNYAHIFASTSLARRYTGKKGTTFEGENALQKSSWLDNYIARSIAVIGIKPKPEPIITDHYRNY